MTLTFIKPGIMAFILAVGMLSAKATSLLLDFGPTAVVPNDAASSPAHFVGGLPGSESHWNTGVISNQASVVYGDGTPATGVSLTVGRSAVATSNLVDFALAPRSAALGGFGNIGIYAGTSPAKDAIFGVLGGGDSGATPIAMGARIDGLPAGDYVVYFSARNTSGFDNAGALPQRFYAKVGASATSYGFSLSDANAYESNSVPMNMNSFVLGDNCNYVTVTVGAGQSLFLASQGATNIEQRGFMNTVELIRTVTAGADAAHSTISPAAASIVANGSSTQVITVQARDVNGNNVTVGGSAVVISQLSGTGTIGSTTDNGNGTYTATVTSPTVFSSGTFTATLGGSTVGTAVGASSSVVTYNATSATCILLDFGPTLVGSTNATLSPGHAAGAVPSSDISWNTGVTNNLGSLIYGDGSAATGVSLTLGRSAAGSTNIDFTLLPRSAALGGFGSGGIYAGTSPEKDAIFGISGGGDSGSTQIAVGARIDGLPPGDYLIYFSSRNTSAWDYTNGATPQRFYAKVGASATSYGFSLSDANAYESNSVPMNTNRFVMGDNCNFVTATVAAGQSLFVAVQGDATTLDARGFMNTVELVSSVAAPTNVAPWITAQPSGSQTVIDGTSENVSFAVAAGGSQPLVYQWFQNGSDLPGATNRSLTLTNVTSSMGGNYSVLVTNAFGSVTSSNALLIVASVPNTAQMTNIWNLLPGDRDYLGTASTERGLAYDSFGTNLLLVSRSSEPARVVVLDPQTGATKYFMDNTGIPTSIANLSLGLNTIGVAEDGVVFAGGVTVHASSPPLYIYRWSQVSSNEQPVLVFAGDPAYGIDPNLRWGDTMAVRGAGEQTQILLSSGSTTNGGGTSVVLLRSSSGLDFQTEISPAVIAVSGVPSGFAQSGLAFGPGTNTFWAIGGTNSLYLIRFDLDASTGAVLYAYSPTTALTNTAVGGLIGIAMDRKAKWLAGVSIDLKDNVRLFDISNPAEPVQRDEELFVDKNYNNVLTGGSAATAIGGNCVFTLDSNNGIKAFQINTNYSMALGNFSITSISAAAGNNLVLRWQSVSGHSYQVQHKDSLWTGTWVNDGTPAIGTGSSMIATNSLGGGSRFYRVLGQ